MTTLGLDPSLAMPYWSIGGHLAIAALILPLRKRLFPLHAHPYFQPVNEFFCTFLWIVWSLECTVISHASSNGFALSTLFVRMLVAPYIFYGACVNPAFNVYTHLRLGLKPQVVRMILLNVLIELLAMVCGLLFVFLQWRAMAMVSMQHQDFLSVTERTYGLRTSPLAGFTTELLVTFASLLPLVFIRESFSAVLISASLTLFLIYLADAATGAFMNPLTAMATAIAFHMEDLGPWDYAVHVVVYWCGPYVGSGLAALVNNWLDRLIKYH